MIISKLNISLFLLLNIAQIVNAQPGFSLLKDVGLINNHYRDMVIDKDTIICYGLAVNDTTANWQQGLLVSKFDSLGNHLMSNLILDSLGGHLAIAKDWGKINTTSDGGYILTAAPVNRKAGIFIKLDHDLQLEFIREYSDTINLSQFYYKKPIELSDGFLMYGWIQRPNYLRDGFIRKVDEQGHTISFNYYGEYNLEELFKDLYPLNDSIWVVAGVSSNGSDPDVWSFLKLINLQGEVIDSWQSELNSEIGLFEKIFPTQDKGYISYGIHLIEVIGFTRIVQSTLAKLDSNFQIEWVQPFGRVASSGAEELWDIEPTSDGHFIGAGESVVRYTNSPSLRGGWLHKFSVEGDSLWGRRDPPPIPVVSGNKGFFAGVGELSSGNIIAVGGAQEGAIFSGWLVKVSPDGCLDTLCNLSTAIEEYLMFEDKLSLYPNPSNGVFTLELPIEYLGKQAIFTIFDLQGQQIWREERMLIPKMGFDVSALSSGLHFLHIEMEGRRWTEKFFVY